MKFTDIYGKVLPIVLVSLSNIAIAQQNSNEIPLPTASQSSSAVDPSVSNQKAVIDITIVSLASSLLAKTKILVNQKFICETGVSEVCKTTIDTGEHEITLDNASDFGTYSEKYKLEAGMTYKFEVVSDWGNILLNSFIPFGGKIFSSKGKDAQVKLKLVSTEKT
jgi:hypothetical protein